MKDNPFKWRHFAPEIILLCVRWYLKYQISLRDVEEMLFERGLVIDHTTIHRWVIRYSPEIAKRVRTRLKPTNDSWRLDETYLKVNGEQVYLYRIVDSEGETVEFLLSRTRDKRAAKRLMRKALASRHNKMPRVITTDKYPATEVAIQEELYAGALGASVEHRMCKYLNNSIEQDHRFIKRRTRPMLGFKKFRAAYSTLIGIETMHMLRKRQAGPMTPRQEAEFIRRIMVDA
jgi:transposase-like protein